MIAYKHIRRQQKQKECKDNRGKQSTADRQLQCKPLKTSHFQLNFKEKPQIIFPLLNRNPHISPNKKIQQQSARKAKRIQSHVNFTQLIELQLKIQKKEYFQTLANQTLTVKGKQKFSLHEPVDQIMVQRQEFIKTPPFKHHRKVHFQLGKTQIGLTLQKSIKKSQSFSQDQNNQFTPWSFNQSQEKKVEQICP